MDDSQGAGPFAQAAGYYGRFRPPYAREALAYLAAAVGDGARVLDLGCGPGTIAIPLSRAGAKVVAVDPDAGMLAEGRRLAKERAAGDIRWVLGRAEDALPDLGRFRLVTLGQSLHWMDRDLVLRRLADCVEDGGGLAIVDEGGARESWEAIAQSVSAKYLGRRSRHPGKHPETAHEPCLGRSTHFANFTVRTFTSEFTRDPASILGCLYSGVSASKPMFGARAAEFEAELLDALRRLNPSGVFNETLETVVFFAPKSTSPASVRS